MKLNMNVNGSTNVSEWFTDVKDGQVYIRTNTLTLQVTLSGTVEEKLEFAGHLLERLNRAEAEEVDL